MEVRELLAELKGSGIDVTLSHCGKEFFEADIYRVKMTSYIGGEKYGRILALTEEELADDSEMLKVRLSFMLNSFKDNMETKRNGFVPA